MRFSVDVTGLLFPMAVPSLPSLRLPSPLRCLGLAVAFGALAAPLRAETPQVLADIAPVAVLTSAVLGAPVTPLVEPGSDPHHFQLRPSQARSLLLAEAVFWLGHGISPWLERALEASAPDALSVDLTEVSGITHRPFQFGAEGEAHEHSHAEPETETETDHSGHDHAEHDHNHNHEHEHDHNHDHYHDHDHDDHAHDHGHDHDHGSFDPHIWLDPANAAAMLAGIEATLSKLDPQGAARYSANAQAAKDELLANAAKAQELLAPYNKAHLVVFHDAYAHWAAGFDLTIIATIAEGDAAAPGAAAQRQLRQLIAAEGADCILIEAQHAPQLAETLAGETQVPLGRIDPMTSERPGDWFVSLANSVVDCLSHK